MAVIQNAGEKAMIDDKINVLAVDDDEMNQSMLEFMLVDLTNKFLKAGNGQQALELLDRNPDIDIILLDLEMPVMDGFETLSRLKQSYPFRQIPVIVIAANKNEILRTLAMGANDFLSKPYDKEELKLRVMNHARSKKLYDMTRDINAFLDSEVARKTAALETSERNTRSIIENAPLAIVVARVSDGKILVANRYVAELFGSAYEKATEIPMMQYFDDKNFRKLIFSQLVEKGSVTGIEANPQKASGERIWVLLSVVMSRFQGEDVIITSFSDITERKRIEDLYRMLSDKSVAGVYVVQDGVFKYLNSNAISCLGYSSEELIGCPASNWIHPEDKDITRVHSREMLKGLRQTPYEFRIIDKAGSIRWVLETVTSIPYEGKQAILGHTMDISQLKEAQQKLGEMQALESSILAAIPHAVLGLENRRIIFANEGVENVFGWTREELIGKSTRILFRSDEAYENVGATMYTTLEKKNTVSQEYEAHYRHKDGRNLICRDTMSRIDGTLIDKRIISTVEDVTDQRNIQMQLLQSEKMSSIGQLAAGVAHEINNPTGYVGSNLETLEEYFDSINSILSKYESLLCGVRENLQGRMSLESLSDQEMLLNLRNSKSN